MGAGVGKFVRLTSLVSPGKSFLRTWYYTFSYLKQTVKHFRYKIGNQFLVKKCYK